MHLKWREALGIFTPYSIIAGIRLIYRLPAQIILSEYHSIFIDGQEEKARTFSLSFTETGATNYTTT
jgi:hypothetical protein